MNPESQTLSQVRITVLSFIFGVVRQTVNLFSFLNSCILFFAACRTIAPLGALTYFSLLLQFVIQFILLYHYYICVRFPVVQSTVFGTTTCQFDATTCQFDATNTNFEATNTNFYVSSFIGAYFFTLIGGLLLKSPRENDILPLKKITAPGGDNNEKIRYSGICVAVIYRR